MAYPSLKSVIATILETEPDQLSEESGLNDTENWDSLKQFFIMADIENEFQVKLTFEEIEGATNVAEIRAALAAHGIVVSD